MKLDFWGMFFVPLFKSLWEFWPIWVLLIVAFLLTSLAPIFVEKYRNKRRFEAGKEWRSDQELLKWLQGMSPTDFEKYTGELFGRLGYIAEVTRASRDGGVDVVLEKDGRKSYVQCKKYYTSKVTEPQVREFYGALADKLASGQGFVVTTNIFTLDAQRFVKDKPIELIDGARLVEYIRLTEKTQTGNVQTLTSNVCPKCGVELVEKKGKFGKFIGCLSYPKCDYTKSAY